ncbi:MAG: DegT/DnrJ/EryC1/StrS aminotransferase family protein [Hyphomicrobiaceae bacterium]
MAASRPSETGAPPLAFIDLAAQQARIRPQLDAAIARVLAHGAYIMGPEVAELERQLAAFAGARHAVTCASGTDALLMIAMAEGIGPGDAVICPAFTFTATPEAVALLGATPVFAEVRAESFNLDPARLADAIAAARKAGLRPKAVMAVDLFGLPADYDAIAAIAEAEGVWILADSAQSFGASRAGRRVGTFGRATATSFFPAKPLGCYGDGGAVFTDDDALAERLKSIRLHGKGDDKYDIVRFGINGRLDTLQAAILIEKLAIFADEIDARERIARRYAAGLADVVTVPVVDNASRSVWAQYTIRVPAAARAGLMRSLASQGIPSNVYYPRPLHHQTAYRRCPVAVGGVPVAEALAREVLSLPMHPYLTEQDQDRVIAGVRRAVGATGAEG